MPAVLLYVMGTARPVATDRLQSDPLKVYPLRNVSRKLKNLVTAQTTLTKNSKWLLLFQYPVLDQYLNEVMQWSIHRDKYQD